MCPGAWLSLLYSTNQVASQASVSKAVFTIALSAPTEPQAVLCSRRAQNLLVEKQKEALWIEVEDGFALTPSA